MGLQKKHDTCIVWLTHRLDDIALEEYIRLQEQCKGNFDSIVLYDDSRHDFKKPNCAPNTRFSLFDIAELDREYRVNRLRTPVTVTPGNTAFPLLDFAQKHSYAYYWMVEYDVRYRGCWNDFFTYFEENKSDLLGTTLFRHCFRPSWCWWKTLKTPRFTMLRTKNRIRGLFPVMRISAEGVRIYIKANRKGWKGHYEVCMPTVLHHYGLAIEDIGGDGEFVAKDNRNRFYTNTPSADGLGPGTFVCPPTQPISEELPDKLYHAVK